MFNPRSFDHLFDSDCTVERDHPAFTDQPFCSGRRDDIDHKVFYDHLPVTDLVFSSDVIFFFDQNVNNL